MPRVLLILTLALFSAPLAADGFADWLKRDQNSFRSFQKQEDRAFREFLRQEWEDFEAFKAQGSYTEPKFPVQPVVDASGYSSQRNSFTAPISLGSGYTRTDGEAGSRFFDYSYRGLPSLVIELYGISMRFPATEPGLPRLGTADNRSLADYWEQISEIDLEKVVMALDAARTELKLGDWGFAKLIYAYAEAQTGPGRLEAYSLSWYLLLRAGIDARIGFDGSPEGIFLMLAVDGTLYEFPYALMEGRRYYFIDLGPQKRFPSRFSSYPQSYPGRTRPIHFSLSTMPEIPSRGEYRDFSFRYQDREIALRLEYENSVISYFAEYPQTPFGAYLAGTTSSRFNKAAAAAFSPLIRGLSEQEAANLLLRFVQTALAYRTDQDQFAREKWMLPEETIHYPYSDCDDRAVLYAWLIRELLELPVIGIQWPGHMATAVAFSEETGGAGFSSGGRRWTICDPTYMGADIGMVMPVYSAEGFTAVVPGEISD